MERIVSDATFVVEGEPPRVESRRRAFLSAAVTLTLGILGSSVLPVPFAFSRTGVLLGLAVSALVGFSNALTGTLLLRSAGHLGEHTFEALAGKAAGPAWKVGLWVQEWEDGSMMVLVEGLYVHSHRRGVGAGLGGPQKSCPLLSAWSAVPSLPWRAVPPIPC